MTAKELIEKLRQFPEDLPVCIVHPDLLFQTIDIKDVGRIMRSETVERTIETYPPIKERVKVDNDMIIIGVI